MILVAVMIVAIAASAQTPTAPRLLPYTAKTVAGQYLSQTNEPKVPLGTGGLATAASVNAPRGVATDSFGNLYIADSLNGLIRKVDAGTGIITTVVGGCTGTCVSVADGVSATAVATINGPRGVEVDADGNLWIAESSGNRILKVTTDNIIHVIAKSAKGGYGGDGTLPTTPSVNIVYNPESARLDPQGNVLIADVGNCVVRKITNPGTPSAIITTVVGHTPPVGNGTKCTVFDNWVITPAPDSEGADCVGANSPYLGQIYDLAVDADGNIYVADQTSYKVRECFAKTVTRGGKTYSAGKIYTIAGTGNGCSSNGCAPPEQNGSTFNGFGPIDALTADIGHPVGLKLDPAGNLYISDSSNNTVWYLDFATGQIRVIGGYGSTEDGRGVLCAAATNPQGDGCPGPWAKLGGPQRLALDPAGNLYIAEYSNHLVRVLSTGAQATLPGHPTIIKDTLGDPPATPAPVDSIQLYYAPGDGPALVQPFTVGGAFTLSPDATCAADPDGNPMPADSCVLNLTFQPTSAGLATGFLKTSTLSGATLNIGLTGVGAAGSVAIDPGVVVAAAGTFHNPQAVVRDQQGNTFVADTDADVVLKNGVVFASGLKAPKAVAVDAAGNVYIADSGNGQVLKVDAVTSNVSTVLSGLSNPSGVAVGVWGNVLVSDTGNNKVLRIDPLTNRVTVAAGGGTSPCTTTEGCPPTNVSLNGPRGLFVDTAGKLYIADTGDSAVFKLDFSAKLITNVGGAATLSSPTAAVTDPAGNIYIVDSATHVVTMLNPASDTASALLGKAGVAGTVDASGKVLLDSPAGLAVDNFGRVVVADSKNNRILGLDRLQSSINFGISPTAFDSDPMLLTAWNIGNMDLTFGSPCVKFGTSFFAADLSASDGTLCSSSGTFAAGTKNILSATFNPAAEIAYSDTATFNGDGVGGATFTVTGTGKNLPKTTIAVVATPIDSNYGDAVTFTSTVAPLSGTGTPDGTVTCKAGLAEGTSDLVNGTAVVSISMIPAGTGVTATCTYNGNIDLWAKSKGTATINIAKAPTTVAIALTLDAPTGDPVSGAVMEFRRVCATATPNSTVGTPANNSDVEFYDNGQLLGGGKVQNGTAVYCTGVAPEISATGEPPSFSAGAHSITAKFMGDTNLASSTSAAAALNITGATRDFSFTFNDPTLTVSGQAGTTISVTPLNYPKATITFTCSNLPAYAWCSFVPNTMKFTDQVIDQTKQTRFDQPLLIGFTLTTDTNGTASLAPLHGFGQVFPVLALLFPGLVFGGFGLLSGSRRRKSLRSKLLFLLTITVLVAMVAGGLIGCGSKSSTTSQTNKYQTPRGATTIQINATFTDGVNATHTVQYPVTIQ